MRDCRAAWDREPVAEVIPEGDAQLLAGLCQAEERVAAVASDVAAGATADFALGDLAADVVLRAIGVQRHLRPVEHHQQGGLVGVQPPEQPVQGGEAGLSVAGLSVEDTVEAGAQLRPATGCRVGTISFQVAVEPPDQPTDMILRGPVQVGERIELCTRRSA